MVVVSFQLFSGINTDNGNDACQRKIIRLKKKKHTHTLKSYQLKQEGTFFLILIFGLILESRSDQEFFIITLYSQPQKIRTNLHVCHLGFKKKLVFDFA